MKRLAKICLILCVLFFALGGLAIGAAFAMGLQPEQLMDLAHFQNRAAKTGLPFGDSQTSYDASDITDLDLDMAVCELTICASEDDQIHISAQNIGNTFVISGDEHSLELSDDRKWKDALELTIALPDKVFESIEMDIGTANITVQCPVRAREFDLDLGVGNVELALLDAEETTIDVGTGDLTATCAGREADYNYHVDCAMGDTGFHHRNRHNAHHRAGFGNSYSVDNNADRELDLACAIGNIEIYFSEE